MPSFRFSVEIGNDVLRTDLCGKVGDKEGDRCTRQEASGFSIGGEFDALPLVGDRDVLEMNLRWTIS